MKLTKRLESMIFLACKQTGSYDPQEALPYVEEQLTGDEYKTAESFLSWVNEGVTQEPDVFPGRRFGHNIKDVFKRFQAERGK